MDRRLDWSHARALLVGLFVATGCAESDSIGESEFHEEHTELWCELSMACEPGLDADSCPQFLPNECDLFDADQAELCLEAMEELVEDAVAGMCVPKLPDSCSAATPRNPDTPDCGGVDGRPIRDSGGFVVAEVLGGGPLAATDAASIASAHWLRAAQMEHASISAFARLSTELLAMGAPLSLVTAAHQAAVDEARHTEVCLSHARAIGRQKNWSLGRLRVVPARPDITLETLAIEALLEGCIGEGIAATQAAAAGRRADADIASSLRGIARDELRHAQLAWQVVGWALSLDESLAVPLRAALAQWQEDAQQRVPSTRTGAPQLGVLSSQERHLIAQTFVRDVTAPALDMVLETHLRRAC